MPPPITAVCLRHIASSAVELSHPRARFRRSLCPPRTLGLDPRTLDLGALPCIARGLRRPGTKEAVHHVSDLAAAPRYVLQAPPRVFGGGRPQFANAHGAVLGVLPGSFLPLLFTFEAARERLLKIAHEELHLIQDRHSSFSP